MTGNVITLTIAKLLGDIAAFVMFVVLTNLYGEAGIGEYSFGMAVGGLFAVLADFGLYFQSIRSISANRGAASSILTHAFLVRLQFALLTLIVLGVLVLVLPSFRPHALVVFALAGYQVLYTLVHGMTAGFVALERMSKAAAVDLGFKLVSSGGVVALALAGFRLEWAVLWFPIATLLALGIVPCLLYRDGMKWEPSRAAGRGLSAVKEAFPYAQSEFLRFVSTRADVLLLALLVGALAAGVYNIAYRVVVLLLFLPHFIGLAILPMATRLYEQSESLEELFRRTLGALALLAIPCTAGLWLTAEDLIELIFGPEFQASVAVLKVLAPLLLVSFLSQFLGALLTACGRQAKRTRSQWIAASVNLGAMFVLIPAFGVVGAAIATLGAESLLALLYALRLRSVLRLSVPWGHILLSLGASLSFCLLFGFVLDTSLILVVPGSAILYLGIVLLSGSVRRNEVSALISVLRGRDA